MTEGVRIIRQLLTSAGAVTAVAPATRIQADILPHGTALPAIRLESISSVPFNTLKRGTDKFFRERVQATALAADYDTAKALAGLIFNACADKFPTVSGLVNVSVLGGDIGSDGYDPNNSARAKPVDLLVRYNV